MSIVQRIEKMSRPDRAHQIELLRECVKYARNDLLECTLIDPLSLQTHMASITVAELERELAAHEGVILREIGQPHEKE